MKRQDYVFGSTTTNVEEQSASALNNGWAELSILYSRVLNGVCAALSQSTNYVSQEVANAIEGMGAELDPADNSQLLTVLQSLAIKETDFQTPVTPTNKGATMKEIEDLVTTSFVFKGYVSTTAPAQNLVEGNLWINSATMPTNFPIAAAAVKQWNGSEWVAYGSDYTPGNFDCFRNLNDNEGYYWFGGEWQVISTDLSTDYFTLNQVSGRWEIKNSVNLPGTPTCNTPSASNTRAIVNVDYVNNNTISSRNFTNCLTEIPQDVKAELFVDNLQQLRIKAGSKVYVPNGANIFDEIVLTSDLITDGGIHLSGFTNDVFVIYNSNTSMLRTWDMSAFYSGDTQPDGISCLWYDTANNKIKHIDYENVVTDTSYSLPLASIRASKPGTSSHSRVIGIKNIFNGFGYIGSTVFALPGVKGLIPNGRNADGSLNNIEVTTSAVQTMTMASYMAGRANAPLALWADKKLGGMEIDQRYWGTVKKLSDIVRPSYYACYYCLEDNLVHYFDGSGVESIRQQAFIGSFNVDSNNRITQFTPKTPFRAVDYNDLPDTISLTTPAGIVTAFAGTTPPAGWLRCDGSAISRTTYAKLFAAIGGNYGTGDGSTTFNLPTQSVLPLGTSAKVTVYGTSKSIQVTDGTSNASLAAGMAFGTGNRVGVGTKIEGLNKGDQGSGLASLKNDTTIGLKTSTTYGDSGIVGTADIANATGAKAIVCIKY